MFETNNIINSQVQSYPIRKKRDYKLQFVVNNLTTQKRIRPLPYQTEGLEKAFLENSKPTKEQKTQLSIELNLNFSNVNTWFQNRRAKQRLQRNGTGSGRYNSDKSQADPSSTDKTITTQSVHPNQHLSTDSSLNNNERSPVFDSNPTFNGTQLKQESYSFEPYTKPLRRIVNRSSLQSEHSDRLELPDLSSIFISRNHSLSDPYLYKLDNTINNVFTHSNFGLDRLNIDLPKFETM